MTDRTILTVNAGSSSLKLRLFDWETLDLVERYDADLDPAADHSTPDYAQVFRHALAELPIEQIGAVGHRVVHGGAAYQEAVPIDERVKRTIADLAELAPLHNPLAIAAIAAVERELPGVPQVAAFDTAFHSTLPPADYLYGVPYEWYERWGIRRYGFHGLSHAYCAERAAQMLDASPDDVRLITCHLGSGCSLAAIASGRSVATTMGLTPLDGVVMGSRSGAVDPGLLLYLLQRGAFDAASLRDALNYRSGLLGVSGISSDLREVLAARASGHRRAELAFDLYTTRLREAIGALIARLGVVDALVFTGGVGEHSAEVRAAVVGPLAWIGAVLDPLANKSARADADIAAAVSPVRLLVIHTREALMVARETRRALAGA